MKQITTKAVPCPSDFSTAGLMQAIELLYNPSFERPLEDTRFIVLLPNSYSGHEMLKNDELKAYSIEWAICRKNVLLDDSWIVCCPDTGAILTCEGA